MKVWIDTAHLFVVMAKLYPAAAMPGQLTVHLSPPSRSSRDWTECELKTPAVRARVRGSKRRQAK